MKKLFIMAAMAVATLASCGGGTPKADLNNGVDTLSYMLGGADAMGFKMQMRAQLSEKYYDEFLKGFAEGAAVGEDSAKIAYMLGLQVGQNFVEQEMAGVNRYLYGEDSVKTISKDNLLAGFVAGFKDSTVLGMNQDKLVEDLRARMDAEQKAFLESQYGENKKAGEEFIAKMAQAEGVQKLPGGTLYKVIAEGKGAKPAANATVKVKYEGKTVDGKVFDGSDKNNNGEPTEIRLYQVIPGWQEALQQMAVGSKWELYIPYNQAYDQRGMGDMIKPFSALIFTVELVSINKDSEQGPGVAMPVQF